MPIGIMGPIIHLMVISTDPQKDSLLITDQTRITVYDEIAKDLEKDVSLIIYENVGGLKEGIRKVQ